jgi:hypothetical protein
MDVDVSVDDLVICCTSNLELVKLSAKPPHADLPSQDKLANKGKRLTFDRFLSTILELLDGKLWAPAVETWLTHQFAKHSLTYVLPHELFRSRGAGTSHTISLDFVVTTHFSSFPHFQELLLAKLYGHSRMSQRILDSCKEIRIAPGQLHEAHNSLELTQHLVSIFDVMPTSSRMPNGSVIAHILHVLSTAARAKVKTTTRNKKRDTYNLQRP